MDQKFAGTFLTLLRKDTMSLCKLGLSSKSMRVTSTKLVATDTVLNIPLVESVIRPITKGASIEHLDLELMTQVIMTLMMKRGLKDVVTLLELLRPDITKQLRYVPGPGTYKPMYPKLGAEHKFGKGIKNKHIEPDDPDILPGPGKYNICHTLPQIQSWQQNQLAELI